MVSPVSGRPHELQQAFELMLRKLGGKTASALLYQVVCRMRTLEERAIEKPEAEGGTPSLLLRADGLPTKWARLVDVVPSEEMGTRTRHARLCGSLPSSLTSHTSCSPRSAHRCPLTAIRLPPYAHCCPRSRLTAPPPLNTAASRAGVPIGLSAFTNPCEAMLCATLQSMDRHPEVLTTLCERFGRLFFWRTFEVVAHRLSTTRGTGGTHALLQLAPPRQGQLAPHVMDQLYLSATGGSVAADGAEGQSSGAAVEFSSTYKESLEVRAPTGKRAEIISMLACRRTSPRVHASRSEGRMPTAWRYAAHRAHAYAYA